MAWTRLDDQFFANPKVIDLSKDAKLLYLSAVTYSAGQLTDGRISPGALRMVAALVDADRSCADELVASGLWERDGDDYLIHDYLEYNPTAAEVRARRQADRDRKRPPSNEGSPADSATDSRRNPDRNDADSNAPVPTPVPMPSNDLGPRGRRRTSAPAATISEQAQATADVLVTADFVNDQPWDVARAVQRTFDLVPAFPPDDGTFEAEQYVRYYTVGKGKSKQPDDWVASFRNWLKREVRAVPPAQPPNGKRDDDADDRRAEAQLAAPNGVVFYVPS